MQSNYSTSYDVESIILIEACTGGLDNTISPTGSRCSSRQPDSKNHVKCSILCSLNEWSMDSYSYRSRWMESSNILHLNEAIDKVRTKHTSLLHTHALYETYLDQNYDGVMTFMDQICDGVMTFMDQNYDGVMTFMDQICDGVMNSILQRHFYNQIWKYFKTSKSWDFFWPFFFDFCIKKSNPSEMWRALYIMGVYIPICQEKVNNLIKKVELSWSDPSFFLLDFYLFFYIFFYLDLLCDLQCIKHHCTSTLETSIDAIKLKILWHWKYKLDWSMHSMLRQCNISNWIKMQLKTTRFQEVVQYNVLFSLNGSLWANILVFHKKVVPNFSSSLRLAVLIEMVLIKKAFRAVFMFQLLVVVIV